MDGVETSRTVVAMDACSARRSEVGGEHRGASGRLSDRLRNHVISAWRCCYEYIWTGLLTGFYIHASTIQQSI